MANPLNLYGALSGGLPQPALQPSAPPPSGSPGVGGGSMPMHSALSALQASAAPKDEHLQLGPQVAWLSPEEIQRLQASGSFSPQQASEAMDVYRRHLEESKNSKRRPAAAAPMARPKATPSLDATATSFFNRMTK